MLWKIITGGHRPARRWAALAVTGGLAVMGLALPATATASTSPVYIITATNPPFHGAAEVVLTCGTDYLYDVGASDTSNGYAVIDQVEPTTASTATIHAREGSVASPTSWTLKGWVVCGPSQPDLHIESKTGANSTLNSGSSTVQSALGDVSCGSTDNVLSGGWRVNASGADLGKITMTGLTPGPTQVSTTATGSGLSRPFSVTTYAICADLPASAAINYPAASITLAGKTASNSCASGESRTGTGFWLTARGGEAVVTAGAPTTNPAGFGNLALVTSAASPSGSGSSWNTWAYIVCARL